tara:strand:+ start:801 stop:1034 length:234 start_codon:yes stop_codon:yes gene_type:complete
MTGTKELTASDFGKLVYNALEGGDWIYCASDEVQKEIEEGTCSLLLDYFGDVQAGKLDVETAVYWYGSDFRDAYNPW